MRSEPPVVRAGLAVLPLVPAAVLAAFVSAGWAPLRALDRVVADRLHEVAHAVPALTTAMVWVTNVFQPTVFRVAVLALVIWLARRGQRRAAIWAAVTMIAGGVLGGLLKLLFGRARPDFLDPVAAAVGYAFPSGHALNSALAVTIVVMLFGNRWLWWSIPLLTALSRVYLGVHWTSDVVAGLLLGVAVPLLTARAFTRTRAAEPAGQR
ncbi:phosphatase PAP2 family protein [Actinoplanes philippinensis]|uniref:Undecaprenyl-diphosphatase n=1 Tax=Actinoplanes philippinensis TaxID=35752 RepID=A0A1I2D0B0_9ACTN|nr:phosphatase PAP2 family protein [Actinoplanes philippinensis]GIE74568.1 phosphatase PAP2 family protein [Actinoplanes philippinensis]SFE73915.1 undecaprenyl-diphosphatase [Actinoplanes philippinensis]